MKKVFCVLKEKKNGFTLIELLVVILIIGILSAIALPQYQVAVAKARYARMQPVVQALSGSMERYYLENGAYPPDTGQKAGMDMMYPANCSNQGSTYAGVCEDNFQYDLTDHGIPNVSGLDMRSKTAYLQWMQNSAYPSARRCFAAKDNNTANSVCKSMGGSIVEGEAYHYIKSQLGTINVYALP